jgi:hypothetical protein
MLRSAMPNNCSYTKYAPSKEFTGEIVAGSLLVTESRKIARLLLEGADKDAWYRAIIVENILQKRSPSSAIRETRLIRHRLELMTADLWKIVAGGSAEVTTQAVLAAAIKHSRLLSDFLDQVVKHHFRIFDFQLSAKAWSDFLEACEPLDSNISRWSESTRKKLGEVVFRILAEAKYVDRTRSLKLTPVVIVDEVRRYLLENREHYVLRCMEVAQ